MKNWSVSWVMCIINSVYKSSWDKFLRILEINAIHGRGGTSIFRDWLLQKVLSNGWIAAWRVVSRIYTGAANNVKKHLKPVWSRTKLNLENTSFNHLISSATLICLFIIFFWINIGWNVLSNAMNKFLHTYHAVSQKFTQCDRRDVTDFGHTSSSDFISSQNHARQAMNEFRRPI